MERAYAGQYGRLYREHWWWRAREAILIDEVEHIVRSPGRGARILDVGCGAGLFFDRLSKFGRVEGIESDEHLVGDSGRWKSQIQIGTLDATYGTPKTFDLVLMLDVIEHVTNPAPMLSRARELLTEDGHLLLTVPAFDWLWTSHDDLNHHVRRYSRTQLQDMLSGCGLRVVRSKYLFHSLVMGKLILRAVEGLRGAKQTVPGVPATPLNAMLTRWYVLESMICGPWLPVGSSLCAVAVRS